MSPEQVTGKRADHRCDLFSLGVVLHEMLTGEAPFQADSIHGIMYQIMNFAPPAPSVKNADVPEMLDLIVAKALAKSADARYQSAAEMALDLRECRDLMLGKVTGGVATADLHAKGAPPPARRPERLAAVKAAPTGAGESEGAHGLALAKSFDSYEATLRLAALTGMAQNPGALSGAPNVRAPGPERADTQVSATDTWQDPAAATPPKSSPAQDAAHAGAAAAPASAAAPLTAVTATAAASPAAMATTAAQAARAAPRASASPPPESLTATPTYAYLWVISGIALAGAIALYILR
jgi:serine/threonine-protein kinase